MLNFTLTEAGATLLSNASALSVKITKVRFVTGSDPVDMTELKGATFNDENGIGQYLRISLKDTGSSTYTFTKVQLFNNETMLAESDAVNITKSASKEMDFVITACFDGAYKCCFDNVIVSVPYATKYREGVVRFSDSTDTTPKEKQTTVYSAAQVDTIVAEAGVDLSGVVPWDVESDVVQTGKVSASQLTLKDNYASATKTVALTVDGTSGYLSINNKLTGTAVQASTSNWNASGNNDKVPTVSVVSSAISAVETAYQTADNGLQSQIDALNAGQNLADIVDLVSELAALDVTDLKAKGEYKKGQSGATWAAGDKVQVLHDKSNADGTIDSSASGVATVYELTKGTATANTRDIQSTNNSSYFWDYVGEYGSDSYSKSTSDSRYLKLTDSSTQTVTSAVTFSDTISSNSFTGKFIVGSTAYSFNTAGSLSFDTSITGSAADTAVPTSLATKTYVDALKTSANTWSSSQTFSSGIVSNGAITGSGVITSYSTNWASASSEIPTTSVVKDALAAQLGKISTVNSVGAMGLFMYTESGNQKLYGETVNGIYLTPVALSLPASGEISYTSVANQTALSGAWKLLSVAFKRTANSPCLVMAVKVSDTFV